jgi:hypothetical protein
MMSIARDIIGLFFLYTGPYNFMLDYQSLSAIVVDVNTFNKGENHYATPQTMGHI